MRLNALYAFDNAYAPFAGVSIHSLINACSDIPEIHVYCVTVNVSDENIEKLRAEVSGAGEGRELHLIDGEPIVEKIKKLPIATYRNSYAPNIRFFFEDFVPDDQNPVLYLDCDTIVSGSLKELISTDFGTSPAAVVRESICGKYYKVISLGEGHRYFNSGIILFTPEWRKQKYTERLMKMMIESPIWTMNPDQDYLNLLLADSLYLLPAKYNFQPVHCAFDEKQYFRCYPRSNYYTEQEIAESRGEVVIYHMYRFCGQFPWHEGSIHPGVELWRQSKATSSFSDLEPIPNGGGLFAFERILYKILPKRVFLRIFATMHALYSNRQVKLAQRRGRENNGK